MEFYRMLINHKFQVPLIQIVNTLKRMMVHMLLDLYLVVEIILIYIAYKLFDVLHVP